MCLREMPPVEFVSLSYYRAIFQTDRTCMRDVTVMQLKRRQAWPHHAGPDASSLPGELSNPVMTLQVVYEILSAHDEKKTRKQESWHD